MPLLLVPLIVVLVAFVAYAQAALARSTSGGFIGWLGSALRSAAFLAGPIGTAAVDLTRWISRAIGSHFAQVEERAVGWIVGLEQAIRYSGAFAVLVPIELFRFANWVIAHGIPDAIRALPNSATTVVTHLTKIVKEFPTKIVNVTKYVRVAAKSAAAVAVPHVTIPYIREWNWIHRHWKALTTAVAGTLPIPFGFTIGNLRKRVRALEKLGAGALAIAAVSTALGRLGLKCLLGRNGKMLGKRLCRVDSSLLDALLLTSVGVVGVVSVRQLAREALALENEAYSLLHKLIKEMPDPAKVTLNGATFPH